MSHDGGAPVEVGERVAVLEAHRMNDAARIERMEKAVDTIKGIGWGVLGGVVVQTVVTVAVLALRRAVS